MDEAMHPLTLMVTGLYGKELPNQNGAPLRLVVPWKYGFKSIKSIVRIRLVEDMPATSWNLVLPKEYGFFANVNPEVDHPRWSQARERRLGEIRRRTTLLFNGYADEVASLYAGMDLRRWYLEVGSRNGKRPRAGSRSHSKAGSTMRLKGAVWMLGLSPIFWMGFRFATDSLGANPIEAVLHWAGRSTLILLLAGLADHAHPAPHRMESDHQGPASGGPFRVLLRFPPPPHLPGSRSGVRLVLHRRGCCGAALHHRGGRRLPISWYPWR